MEFHYQNMMTEYLFYNDGNNLLLEGDFGYLKYNNETFFSTQIRFYNPSLHTFNNRMPFEMQIVHQDSKNNQINISIFFKFSEDSFSDFLSKLGFDDAELKNQQAFHPKGIKEEIHLENYVNDSKYFYVYESNLFLPPCIGKSYNFLLTDVLNISTKQIENFPQLVFQKTRNIQKRNSREIYTSFKQEEVDKKMAELKKKIEMQKKLQEQIKKLNEVSLEGKEKKSKEKEKETKKENKNEKENNVNCNSKKTIPLKSIKNQVKAMEEVIKANDPKILSVNDKGSDLNRNLPDSAFTKISKILEEKFKDYLKLMKNVDKIKDTKEKETSLLQMKSYENFFKEKKYEPYLEFIQIKKTSNSLRGNIKKG